jgi:hypothetical protein
MPNGRSGGFPIETADSKELIQAVPDDTVVGQMVVVNSPIRTAKTEEVVHDHRGIVACDPIGALARLQLSRASAMSGDRSKATSADKDFLALWKYADPDIPILKEA